MNLVGCLMVSSEVLANLIGIQGNIGGVVVFRGVFNGFNKCFG